MLSMRALLALTTRRALAVGIIYVAPSHSAVWHGHESYSLGLLDGTDGYRITAESSTGMLGFSVAGAGDVNNDGFKDAVIGESPEFRATAGAAYVVFGFESLHYADLDVSSLDGVNGFKIEGSNAGDYAGTSVAGAGDINGDGYDDIVMGAWGASSGAGEIFVVFGAQKFPAVVTASDLDGSRGFLVRGATTSDTAGFSVAAAGDVNNDGAADLVVGAHRADPQGSMSGEAYVIFGSLDWTAETVDLENLGTGGLTLHGGMRREYVGYSVAGAGDVNDDGYSDVIISAFGADKAYVLYGAPTFSPSIYSMDEMSGSEGFVIYTGNDGDVVVVGGAGDINGDGYGDILVGHPLADPDTGNSAGATYVIFGGGAMESQLNVLTELDGTNGFVLEGAAAGDLSGMSIAEAGDINQDGYGDIVVGAPGVGNDAGAAYIIFGREKFSSASYTLGSIDSDHSLPLTFPSSLGFGGYSVAGTGDMNQDGFPDLVVGARKAGAAGEAFIVFPHLLGTPPPTPSPTPAPASSTPTPTSGKGATPSPTVNVGGGLIGGGTVYEGPGVFVRAQELGGKVSLGADRWFGQDTRVSMALESLYEKNAAGGLVGLSAEVPHVVDGGGLVYEVFATRNVTVEGIAAMQSIMTTAVLDGETTITITTVVFEEGGVITNGGEQIEVHPGNLKISVSVSDWPFCDPSTAPTRNDQETPSTVCARETRVLEAGTYLDVMLSIQGPSFSQPVLQYKEAMAGDGEDEDAIVGRGMEYVMSGGTANAKLIMSEWVETDDYGWTKPDDVLLSGSSFTVRFPASSGTLYYDPIFELTLTPNKGGVFWLHVWLLHIVIALSALLAICMMGCVARVLVRWREKTKKVSPNSEGVAPAVNVDIEAPERKASCFINWFCKKGSSKSRQERGTPTSEERTGDVKVGSSLRNAFGPPQTTPCRKPKSKLFSNQTQPAQTTRSGGGGTRGAGEDGDVKSHTPDWIQNIGGAPSRGPDNAAHEASDKAAADVPDWLAEAAGPAAAAVATANKDPNAGNEPYGDGYYGQGYGCGGHDGYGYGGCGYDGYNGYYDDGFNGYYGQGGNYGTGDYFGVSFDPNNTTASKKKSSSSSNAVTGRVNAGSEETGGGGLSWLSNAANTLSTLAEREEEEDGEDATSNTQQQSRAGTGPGATQLPPIGDATGAASVPPWMAIK